MTSLCCNFVMTWFTRSSVWEKEDTWEGMFYDAVHTEREILGMNRYPHEMQDRLGSSISFRIKTNLSCYHDHDYDRSTSIISCT